MAEAGLKDILIANEIVGEKKYQRIQKLAEKGIDIKFGLDSIAQAELIEKSFEKASKPAQCVIEIEVGERRSGIVEEEECQKLLDYLKSCPHIHLRGVFSHDGDSYSRFRSRNGDGKECKEITLHSPRKKETIEYG